jgi:hypothetical protein
MKKEAFFSKCRKYRYMLTRQWDANKPMVMFVGLNPSTANEVDDDPTIRRVIGFAKSWNYGGVYMCNLFAYVSTNPDDLITSGENITKNNEALKFAEAFSDKVIFAWGCFKQHKNRMIEVISMFPNAYCLGLSKDGFPKHPLYLKKDLQPILYKNA